MSEVLGVLSLLLGILSLYLARKTKNISTETINDYQVSVMDPILKAILLLLRMRSAPMDAFFLEYTWASFDEFHTGSSWLEPRESVYPNDTDNKGNRAQSKLIKILMGLGMITNDSGILKLTNKGRSISLAIEKEDNVKVRYARVGDDHMYIDPFWTPISKRNL